MYDQDIFDIDIDVDDIDSDWSIHLYFKFYTFGVDAGFLHF